MAYQLTPEPEAGLSPELQWRMPAAALVVGVDETLSEVSK